MQQSWQLEHFKDSISFSQDEGEGEFIYVFILKVVYSYNNS